MDQKLGYIQYIFWLKLEISKSHTGSSVTNHLFKYLQDFSKSLLNCYEITCYVIYQFIK